MTAHPHISLHQRLTDIEYILGLEPSEEWDNIFREKLSCNTWLQHRDVDVSRTRGTIPVGNNEEQQTFAAEAAENHIYCINTHPALKIKAELGPTGGNRYVCNSSSVLCPSTRGVAVPTFSHTGGGQLPTHMRVGCGEAFSTRGELPGHLADSFRRGQQTSAAAGPPREAPAKRPPLHVCKDCGTSFTKVQQLSRHNCVPTEVKFHVCDVCGKSFAQLRYLKCHIRTHTGDHLFRCEVCGKAFTHSRELLTHNTVHTGGN